MPLALSTRWLGARPASPERLLEVLRALDVRACFVGSGARTPEPDPLDRTLRPAGAKVVGVAAEAFGEVEAGFASRAPEAIGRTVGAARAAAGLGKRLGARHVVLRLGRFELERAKEREGELLAALRRDGPTEAAREQAAAAAAAVDRRLEPVLERACRLLFDLCRAEPEIRFAVVTPAGPFELASRRALSLLFDEVRERNLGYWHDVGAAHLAHQLGLAAPHEWLGDLGARTFGATLQDAAGADLGLPPGAGEVDFRAAHEALPSGVPAVLEVDGRFPLAELKLATSYVRSLGF
ncbi:MAG: hypothetical protein ACF8XB_05775 [Planctomycetota bacterium JB042]